MNKHDFVRVVAKESNYSISEVENIVNAIFDCITEQLSQGEEVSIARFGKFYTAPVAAKSIKSPWTSEPVEVEEHNKPKFKFFDAVKEAV